MSSFTSSDFIASAYAFKQISISEIEQDLYTKNFPIVYILYDVKSSKAYIGESASALKRMLSHLAHPQKKKLKFLYIISSAAFNKSATLDLESRFIKYMAADEKFILLNGNAGLSDHNYYQRNLYSEMFHNIWSGLKFGSEDVKDITEIHNSDLFKYSPYKSLSADQYEAAGKFLKILSKNKQSTTFVEGSAGTGKTILAVYLIKLLLTKFEIEDYEDLENDSLKLLELVKEIQNKKDTLSIGLVVPMVSLRKTLKKVFKNVAGLKASMVLSTSDVLKKEYDILIVDEAHRLKRREGITNYDSFDKNNRKLKLDDNGTELDWVIRSSRHQIFFYDQAQSVRPSDITEDVFLKLKKRPGSEKIQLSSQLRTLGGTDYIGFIDDLINLRLRDEKKFNDPAYDLKIFTHLPDMIAELKEKEEAFGLSRMIAGYGWKWVSKNTEMPDAVIDGVELFWNRVPHDWINSTNSLNEIGCIHTTQGYDLNYAGIIIGNEIKYKPEKGKKGKIEIDKKQYFDSKGKSGVNDNEVLKQYIINIYKTLLYRGIKGTYIYICNDNLREYFQKYIPTHN